MATQPPMGCCGCAAKAAEVARLQRDLDAVVARQAEEILRLREQNLALCRRLAGEEGQAEGGQGG